MPHDTADDAFGSLPNWSLELIAVGAVDRLDRAQVAGDRPAGDAAAEIAAGAYQALIARGDDNAETVSEWHAAAARALMALGRTHQALALAGAAGNGRGMESLMDRRVLAEEARRAGDVDTAAALAAEALCVAPLVVGTNAELHQTKLADVLADVARSDPETAVTALQATVGRFQQELAVAEVQDLATEAPEERLAPAYRYGLAVGHQVLARVHALAGEDDEARAEARSAQAHFEHECFGRDEWSLFRGSSMGAVERAFDAGRSVLDVPGTSGGFDASIARMYAHLLRAGQDPDLAADCLSQAQAERDEVERLLVEQHLSQSGGSGATGEAWIEDAARHDASNEAHGHYLDALTRALPRARPECGSRLVDEGEAVMATASLPGTPLVSYHDIPRRWAQALVAAEDRAGLPLSRQALRAVLRLERNPTREPGMSTSPRDVDELFDRVVTQVATEEGAGAVLEAVEAYRSDDALIRGDDVEPRWDFVRARAGEAILVAGGLEPGAAAALRADVLDRYGRVVASPSGRIDREALVAWERLAADPEFQEALPGAAGTLAERMAARSTPPYIESASLEIGKARRVISSLPNGVEGLDGVTAKLTERSLAAAEAAVDASRGALREATCRLVEVDMPEVAAELLSRFEGEDADRLTEALERSAAIRMGDLEGAAEAIRWADGIDPTSVAPERQLMSFALRATQHAAGLVEAFAGRGAGTPGLEDTDWDAAAAALQELGLSGSPDVLPRDDVGHGPQAAPGPADGHAPWEELGDDWGASRLDADPLPENGPTAPDLPEDPGTLGPPDDGLDPDF